MNKSIFLLLTLVAFILLSFTKENSKTNTLNINVFEQVQSNSNVKKIRKLIVGTWGVDSVDLTSMLDGLSEEEKGMYEAFLPMMEEAMKSMEMTYEKDGKFIMKASILGQDQSEEGTWFLSEDGKVLTTKFSDVEENAMTILELSAKKMVVNTDIDGQQIKVTFVKGSSKAKVQKSKKSKGFKRSKKLIVGTWNLDEVDLSTMLEGLPDDEKEMYEAFFPMMEEALLSMKMTFAKDGKYTLTASMMGEDQMELGTWSLSEDGKTLTTKSSDGQENKMTVKELSAKKMVVNSDLDGLSIKMIFVKK